ncbi:MAG: polysaccharide biosynthesis tyrosine autokinase, partial [Gemmatimonadetes bacterium]|nr:polysaccharide biosynthesis tyrosine autokinase [Gemmatimonadota bacterium]
MPHDNLIPPILPPDDGSIGRRIVPSPAGGGEVAFHEDDDFRRPGSGRSELQRALSAVMRRKWMLALALLVGMVGAVGSYMVLGVQYTAEGNLWIQVEQRGGGARNVGPIQQGELLQPVAWIDLLNSFAVLDPVVIAQRLYLSTPPEFSSAFASFRLGAHYTPDQYTLDVSHDGRHFTLSTATGTKIQSGTLGDSIGIAVGFLWQPEASTFPAGSEVPFSVMNPRDASRNLQQRLMTNMTGNGNFIGLSLTGSQPEKITNILNAVMDQYVQVAARLKRGQLDEQLNILQHQLQSTGAALRTAERNLEDFRVRTITLPSDAASTSAGGTAQGGPVFDRFFQMKVDLAQMQQDRQQLQRAVDSLPQGNVRIEALEMIPEVNNSSELKQALAELVTLRAQLRTLRNDYTDDYPPVQDLLRQIATLEHQTIPRMTNALITELRAQENQLSGTVAAASTELSAIPPRTIEEARLRRQVTIQEGLYNDLRSRVETAQLASAGSIPDVQILDRASVPRVPSKDDRLRFGLMILFGSLGAAVGLSILLDRTSRTIQDADEVGEDFGLEILGFIPRIESVAGARAEDNAAQVVEAFRELRVTLSFAYGTAGPLTLTISSPAAEEGKTLTATYLAVAFAEMGRRTLLIDADTRRGDAHRLLGVERKPGLTDYLRARTGGDIIQKTTYEHLEFIGCGARGATSPEMLASNRMASFLGTLKRLYDVIIIDSPPLAAGADALVLAGLAGNMAVVLRTGSTDKRLAVAKLDSISRLPIRILGAVLNDIEPKGSYYRYYGSYLPGYRTTAEVEDDQAESLEEEAR